MSLKERRNSLLVIVVIMLFSVNIKAQDSTQQTNIPTNVKVPLLVINNEISTIKITDIPKESIISVAVLDSLKAKEKYGDKGRNGAIEFELKKNSKLKEDKRTISDKEADSEKSSAVKTIKE